MITNQDLDRIRTVVRDEVSSGVSSAEERIKSELRIEIVASEERIKNELEARIESKILASEKRIIREIGDFVDDHLLPQIDEKADKKDLVRLEKRVNRLESPVV